MKQLIRCPNLYSELNRNKNWGRVQLKDKFGIRVGVFNMGAEAVMEHVINSVIEQSQFNNLQTYFTKLVDFVTTIRQPSFMSDVAMCHLKGFWQEQFNNGLYVDCTIAERSAINTITKAIKANIGDERRSYGRRMFKQDVYKAFLETFEKLNLI